VIARAVIFLTYVELGFTVKQELARGKRKKSIRAHAQPPGSLKFAEGDAFQSEVRRRVDQFLRDGGRRPRDCPQMYMKTAIVFAWLWASYALLVFAAVAWWQALALAIMLGLAMAALGFNVQHDGGHRAYSNRPWINKLMAMTLDLLGGSSYIWARKHNTIHHTYANITGHDDDIDVGPFGRMSPHQKWLPWHRLQHYYLWLLYGVLAFKWQFFDDFWSLILGRVGRHPLARPRGWDLAVLVGGKLLFFSLAFLVPMLLHPVWVVVVLYVAASFTQAMTLSLVFQLAHCVEEADFPMPRKDTGRMATPWAVHQVETTVDFARGNRLLSWFLGGLNFQIEHHLVPHICHVHYPAIAKIVEETCREFGLRYVANKSFLGGLVSHFRWLRRMAMPIAECPRR
jgi:linoleoyl-CoA desaturase